MVGNSSYKLSVTRSNSFLELLIEELAVGEGHPVLVLHTRVLRVALLQQPQPQLLPCLLKVCPPALCEEPSRARVALPLAANSEMTTRRSCVLLK